MAAVQHRGMGTAEWPPLAPRRYEDGALVMVDADGILCPSHAAFEEEAVRLGFDKPPYSYPMGRDLVHWFSAEDVGCTLDELLGLFRAAHERYMDIEPYPLAVETLWELSESHPTARFWYVSSRDESTEGTFKEWVRSYDFPHPENVVAMLSKEPWIAENRPNVVIDDRVRTLVNARLDGATGVALLQHHNVNLLRELPDIYIEKDWPSIGERVHQALEAL